MVGSPGSNSLVFYSNTKTYVSKLHTSAWSWSAISIIETRFNLKTYTPNMSKDSGGEEEGLGSTLVFLGCLLFLDDLAII